MQKMTAPPMKGTSRVIGMNDDERTGYQFGWNDAIDALAQQDGQQDGGRDLLGELLAVIHRDGGHYQAEHGTEKAVKDAMDKFYTSLPAAVVTDAMVEAAVEGFGSGAGFRPFDVDKDEWKLYMRKALIAALSTPAAVDPRIAACEVLADSLRWFTDRAAPIQSKFDLYGPDDTAKAMKGAFADARGALEAYDAALSARGEK